MKKSMSITVALALVLVVTGSALASNMGFKKTFQYTKNVPTSNVHWISLPFFYNPTPSGVGANATWNPTTDAEDLGNDLGGTAAGLLLIQRFNPNTGSLENWQVGSPSSTALFSIDKGVGYGVKYNGATMPATTNAVVVGSHDNAFTKTYPSGTPISNVHWVSIPYHFKATPAGVGANATWNGITDAEDWGQQLGGTSKVLLVQRFNPSTGSLENWQVGSPSSTALFQIDIGSAYAFKNLGGQSVIYNPSHF